MDRSEDRIGKPQHLDLGIALGKAPAAWRFRVALHEECEYSFLDGVLDDFGDRGDGSLGVQKELSRP